MYRVDVTDRAKRFFESASKGLQRRLDRCFAQLSLDPRRHPNIKALSAQYAGLWRYRVGDYRVVYRIDDELRVVIVLLIAHRKDVYE